MKKRNKNFFLEAVSGISCRIANVIGVFPRLRLGRLARLDLTQ